MTCETSSKCLPTNQAAQVRAVKELREYDHAFLPKRIVNRLTKPFGFVCKTYVEHADPPGTFKGLSLPNGKKSMDGRDAAEVAAEICNHLKAEYEFKFGRGAQLCECCDALLAHLEAAP